MPDYITHRLSPLADRRWIIAVTGSSGLIGSALCHQMKAEGHEVRPVVRKGMSFETDALDGAEAVVHLAGEPIFQRWNKDVRDHIEHSRVDRTRLLSEALDRLPRKPKVLVSSSAIGYYGDRGDDILTEDSRPGTGFLAKICKEWEAATKIAEQAGIRTVHVRTGIVTTPEGGALGKMMTPFKLGLGGRLSGGHHYMSWISLEDQMWAIMDCIADDRYRGPVNLVGPNPVTNRQFTKTLAHVLRRPAIFPVPKLALKLAFGDVAREALLVSARVQPVALDEAGFTFGDPDLEPALRKMLGRPDPKEVKRQRKQAKADAKAQQQAAKAEAKAKKKGK